VSRDLSTNGEGEKNTHKLELKAYQAIQSSEGQRATDSKKYPPKGIFIIKV
jgi:hypothetical protein